MFIATPAETRLGGCQKPADLREEPTQEERLQHLSSAGEECDGPPVFKNTGAARLGDGHDIPLLEEGGYNTLLKAGVAESQEKRVQLGSREARGR